MNNLKVTSKKGFLDISFSWIFAFLVGGIILFGAIYGVARLTSIQSTQFSAEVGSTFSNLLSPLEAGLESGRSITITLPVESRIENSCETFGDFGSMTLTIRESEREKYSGSGVGISSVNKYLFSPTSIEGKEFFVFAKEFNFPFKVSNLIYVLNSEERYCFLVAPNEVRRELSNFNAPNFEFSDCSPFSKKVCFGRETDCEILVDYTGRTVQKNGQTMHFATDALMYGAIFSDKLNYECQVSRLMKRTKEISDIYYEKSVFLLQVGCDSSVDSLLLGFNMDLSGFQNSQDLNLLESQAGMINSINRNSGCRLW